MLQCCETKPAQKQHPNAHNNNGIHRRGLTLRNSSHIGRTVFTIAATYRKTSTLSEAIESFPVPDMWGLTPCSHVMPCLQLVAHNMIVIPVPFMWEHVPRRLSDKYPNPATIMACYGGWMQN